MFQKLVKEFFDLEIKRNPEWATFIGLHEHDDELSDATKERIEEDIKIYKEYLKKFQETKPFSEEEEIDRSIMIHHIKLVLLLIDEVRDWESDPDIMDSLGSVLFVMVFRDYAPLEERAQNIIKRIQKMPKVIDQAKGRISRPYKLWTNIAIESCDYMIEFVKSLTSLEISEEAKHSLETATKRLVQKINEYKKFLQSLLPETTDKYTIGQEKFDKLLELRELGATRQEILALGEKYLADSKQHLNTVANKIDPSLSVEDVKKQITSIHPKTFDKVLEEYRRSVARARKYLIDNRLVDVPDGEHVIITSTPEFLRHTTPFAAYFQPGYFEKQQTGIYIVTPSDKEKVLEKHNIAAIHNTSVHEAYPGHHLQLVAANKNPSHARIFSHATETIEGWAHYCEEYMHKIGYNKEPEIEFIQTLDMIWRAARIIIDIKLHTDQMTFDEAVGFLVEQTGMAKENAIAEVNRYTKAPAYQLSYLFGKHLIKELKEDVKKQMGDKFSDRFFHDTFIKAGSLPIKYMRKEFALRIKEELKKNRK